MIQLGSIIEYRNVKGRVTFEDDVYWASTLNTYSYLTIHSELLEDLEKRFQMLIDDYLALCDSHNMIAMRKESETKKAIFEHCWEDTSDIEENIMNCGVIPDGEFKGVVKITIEYIKPSKDDS